MKKIYILLCFALGSTLIHAQNESTKAADKLFERLEYVDAAAEYLKLAEKDKADSYVYKQLADSYYNVFNSKDAIKWYAKATESQQDAETYYRYAQMLKAEGDYAGANKQMQQFASLAPNDQRAITFKKDPEYLPKLRNQAKLYDQKPLNINTDKSEFGAFLSNENILYFASARNEVRKSYGWTNEPFLDLYSAVANTDGTFAEATPVSSINSQFHDGPAAITADGQTMYFASESFKEKEFTKDKKNNLKQGQVYLFKATKDGDKWTNITELPINGKDFSSSNPSVSSDGKTLYFSSNRPGSTGGNDIWKVSIADDGSFGTPQNLGAKINTPANESFPFIAENNILYFASDGLSGFGGLDVFMFDLNSEATPKNLGAPINSAKDDFAFSFNHQKKIGFFSSNRDGNDNIYQANPVCSAEIKTLVTDSQTGKTLSNAEVIILDSQNNVIEKKYSTSDGDASYTVDCDKQFVIQVTKTGYESKTFPANVKSADVAINAALQPIQTIISPQDVTLNAITFEFDKSNITRDGAFELDKLVQAMNTDPKMVILVKAHTDNRGSDAYNKQLSERRAKSTVQYVISKGIDKSRISGVGLGESEPKIDCQENCTEIQHETNRRSEFLIVKK